MSARTLWRYKYRMSNVSSAKKTGRPPKDTEAVNVRLDREMLAAIDLLVTEAAQSVAKPEAISRPEALRRAAREGLTKMGLLRP